MSEPQSQGVKRLPVISGKMLVGIITRANILQAVASLAREIPDPTADDQHIRDRILRQIQDTDWRPAGFQVTVRNGVVHLHGVIFDDSTRKAAMVLAENTAGGMLDAADIWLSSAEAGGPAPLAAPEGAYEALSMPGVRAAAKSPNVGTPLGRPTLPAFHRSERTSALGQCWNACSTATTITVVGSLPSTAKRRLRAGSALTRARPLTR